jgi:transposase
MEEVDERNLHVERVAALDLGKATLGSACGCRMSPSRGVLCRRCVALPPPPARCWRRRTGCAAGGHPCADGNDLGLLEERLHLLEAEGFHCGLVNGRDMKHVPGGPRPTRSMQSGRPRWPSGACARHRWPPGPIRQPRDLTRYRRSLIQDRTRELQRMEKLLEDA